MVEAGGGGNSQNITGTCGRAQRQENDGQGLKLSVIKQIKEFTILVQKTRDGNLLVSCLFEKMYLQLSGFQKS